MLNAAAAALFAIGYAWRVGDQVALDKTRWGQLALSAIAVAFLLAATWLGASSPITTASVSRGRPVTRTGPAAAGDATAPPAGRTAGRARCSRPR